MDGKNRFFTYFDMKTREEIEKAAHVYANEVCPHPSKYDAPFYTTQDKFIDLHRR